VDLLNDQTLSKPLTVLLLGKASKESSCSPFIALYILKLFQSVSNCICFIWLCSFHSFPKTFTNICSCVKAQLVRNNGIVFGLVSMLLLILPLLEIVFEDFEYELLSQLAVLEPIATEKPMKQWAFENREVLVPDVNEQCTKLNYS